MAAPSAPNPMPLILLAAVGIGVFWFMSRRQAGGPLPVVYQTPDQNAQAAAIAKAQTDVAKYSLAAGLVGKAFDFFGERAKGNNPYSLSTGWGTGTADGWGVQVQNDGVAYNPSGNNSASDSIYSLAYGWK
ncbi:hypothetical protein [Hydrogenophaga sp. PBC]|uniref:hypothetical protein n=1 Tax=Hydrogenophaga sp. PBC TaxID=795665 RepID=UPI0002607735|nr:hypothetical protein [Hydrogenophaga sp. PBC]